MKQEIYKLRMTRYPEAIGELEALKKLAVERVGVSTLPDEQKHDLINNVMGVDQPTWILGNIVIYFCHKPVKRGRRK